MHDPSAPLPPGSLSGATIAFDLDGTLVDSAPDLVATLNAVLESEQLPPLPYDTVRTMVGHGAKRMLESGFLAAGSPLSEDRSSVLVAQFITHYLARIAQETRPFPGCLEVLDQLAAAGATLVVCTNKRTDLAVALLEGLGMAGRFTAIIGADAAPAPKPDARHLQHTVAVGGGRIEDAILIGDSATDYHAARNAKAPVIIFTHGYSDVAVADLGADAVIDHFDELPAHILRLLRP